MTTLKQLKPGTGSVNISAVVKSIGEVKEINKYGRTLRVCTAIIGDSSGTMDLILWNDQIDSIKPGAKVTIENGYVNEFQSIPQLTLGKFGKMTVA